MSEEGRLCIEVVCGVSQIDALESGAVTPKLPPAARTAAGG